MEARPVPVRRLRRLAAVAVGASVLAGCGGGGLVGRAPAATVNGVDISASHVQDLVDAQVAYLEAVVPGQVGQQGGDPAAADQEVARALEPYLGPTADSRGATGTAEMLGAAISLEIYEKALEDVGGEVTEAQREEARTAVQQQLEGQGLEESDVAQVIVEFATEQRALQEAIAAEAEVPDTSGDREQQLRDAFDEQRDDYTELCLLIVQADDEGVAQGALERVEGGEDFAAVAEDVSPDTAADGETCVATADVAGVYPDEAYDAEPGDVLGPAETPSGWLLVRVESVNVPEFEDVRDQLEQSIPAPEDEAAAARQAFVDEALREALAASEVTVDPRYGTWDAGSGRVVPPEDPAAAPTTEPVPGLEPEPAAP